VEALNMKTFDSASIYDRLVEKLSQNASWKAIVGDSVIAAVLKAVAETNAETCRYMEYLYQESRWDTAQNSTSIAAAAGQLGYKPARMKSAMGTLYLSLDPRIHLVGRTIFKEKFLNKAITSWSVPTEDILLDNDLTITDSDGGSYLFTSINPLEAESYYQTNTIMQGIRKSIIMPVSIARTVATRSKLDPYIYIPIEITSCEDANRSATRSLFQVFINNTSGVSEEYRVVDTLHLSSSSDNDVEVYPDLYNRDLMYLKFNTSTARGKVLNLSTGSGVESIEVCYVETLGEEGNVSSVFKAFTVTGFDDEDTVLYGINLEAITGGAAEESAYDIKTNAPLYYMNSYAVATKEAYENALLSIDFGSNNYASKVHVYADTEEMVIDGVTQTQKITAICMLLSGLDDYDSDDYDELEETVNYYLSSIKAPTDVLRIVPPTYVGFSVGLDCTADRASVDNLATLKSNIRDLIDTSYGSESSNLDFDRSVYASDIISATKQAYPALLGMQLEVEAINKLSWDDAIRKQPVETSSTPIQTIRLPFAFNSVFIGDTDPTGFRDFQTGATYVLRVDIMYRRSTYSTLSAYHTSIFVKEDSSRTLLPWYAVADGSGNSAIWPSDEVTVADGYPQQNSAYAKLPNTYQYRYKKRVYSDAGFTDLITDTANGDEVQITSYATDLGAQNSYLIVYQPSTSGSTTGAGYVELDVLPIYETLVAYSAQDAALASLLADYPEATVRCGVATPEVLQGFIDDVLANYVEIYVAMRPYSQDMVLEDVTEENSAVLYIDSADADSTTGLLTNLATERRSRLISVECELV
jgi:hypothetical protein